MKRYLCVFICDDPAPITAKLDSWGGWPITENVWLVDSDQTAHWLLGQFAPLVTERESLWVSPWREHEVAKQLPEAALTWIESGEPGSDVR